MGFETEASAAPTDPQSGHPKKLQEKIPALVEHFRLSATRQGDDTIVTVRDRRKRNARRTETWTRVRDLGQGSFGLVRLEKKISNGAQELRAVKEIVTVARPYNHFSTACAQELYALALLSKEEHADYFAEFYGWFESGRRVYLAMEYFPFGDLSEHLDSAIPEIQACDIAKQLLTGLQVIHGYGITHRDLKPQNIFVVEKSPEWWVKIGDFGICKRIEEDDTCLYTAVGTRLFMAPEMVDEHREDAYTNAVDIWALGCVLYLTLTGTRLFANRKDVPAVNSHWLCPRNLLEEKTCSLKCIDFVTRLLAIDAGKRPTAERAKDMPWICESNPLNERSLEMEPTKLNLEEARGSRLDANELKDSSGSRVDQRDREEYSKQKEILEYGYSKQMDIPGPVHDEAQEAESFYWVERPYVAPDANDLEDVSDSVTTTPMTNSALQNEPKSDAEDSPDDSPIKPALSYTKEALAIHDEAEISARVQQALDEGFPSDLDERESFFMEQIASGEDLASQGSDPLGAAMCFYKCLKVYPEPRSLLNIYENTIPADVLVIIAIAMKADNDEYIRSLVNEVHVSD